MEEKIIHHTRLMRKNGNDLEWRIVCNEQLIDNEEVTGNIDKISCPSCREKTEARLKHIQEEYGSKIAAIPWVKEAIKDGVFEDD